jgi:hypothetical protein
LAFIILWRGVNAPGKAWLRVIRMPQGVKESMHMYDRDFT